jgi:flagellar basal-body rod protein FlgF
MDNVGYLALSRAAMLDRATDVTANNIANANTDGFRAARAAFEKMLVDTGTDGPTSEMAYAIDAGTWSDTSEGGIVATGNALDLAMQGDAWFSYQTEGGYTAVGRDGSFMKSQDGTLVTSAGHAVLDVGGAPVQLPAEAVDFSIAEDGTISTPDGAIVGQVGIFDAPQANTWARDAGGMLRAPDDQLPLVPSVEGRVIQGFVEQSNVNPISEITKLISLQRAYERTMSLADSADSLRKSTLQRLGRSV